MADSVETDLEHSESSNTNLTLSQAWLWGLLSSILVSCLGILVPLLIVPVLKSKKLSSASLNAVLAILIAFAAGSLFGDVAIHILPEIFGSHDHGHEEDEADGIAHEEEKEESTANSTITSLLLCCGIFFFIILEKLFMTLGISHDDNHENSHEQGHALPNHDHHPRNINQKEPTIVFHNLESERKEDQIAEKKQDAEEIHEAKNKTCCSSLKGKKSRGYLMLVANFLHNVMDGLALGASFSSLNSTTGISTLVAIIAHEIPHELSDVAILVEAKFGIYQAISCNLFTNFSAFLGAIIGLAIGSEDEASNAYIMAFVAGNFIYLSCSTLIPMITNMKRLYVSIMQLFAFILGIGLMFVVLEIEAHE